LLVQEPYVGKEAQDLSGVLKLNYPMKHGVIENWDDMESLWSHVYTQLAVLLIFCAKYYYVS
jgi:actin-related protein